MPHIHFITGEQGTGKSTLMNQIMLRAREKGITCSGFIAKGFWRDASRSGFDLMLVNSGIMLPFCRDEYQEGWIKLRRFYFSPKALEKGKEAMAMAMELDADLWLIDEIGPIDLAGDLWHDTFSLLLKTTANPVLVSVRPALTTEVAACFGVSNYTIHQVADTCADQVLEQCF